TPLRVLKPRAAACHTDPTTTSPNSGKEKDFYAHTRSDRCAWRFHKSPEHRATAASGFPPERHSNLGWVDCSARIHSRHVARKPAAGPEPSRRSRISTPSFGESATRDFQRPPPGPDTGSSLAAGLPSPPPIPASDGSAVRTEVAPDARDV